jgi:hypothetical protein
MIFIVWIFVDNSNGNVSSEEKDADNESGEMGGLFKVSQRKKININDQEDYTINKQNSKHNWELDEVWE